jgi:hypothetical protein
VVKNTVIVPIQSKWALPVPGPQIISVRAVVRKTQEVGYPYAVFCCGFAVNLYAGVSVRSPAIQERKERDRRKYFLSFILRQCKNLNSVALKE